MAQAPVSTISSLSQTPTLLPSGTPQSLCLLTHRSTAYCNLLLLGTPSSIHHMTETVILCLSSD